MVIGSFCCWERSFVFTLVHEYSNIFTIILDKY